MASRQHEPHTIPFEAAAALIGGVVIWVTAAVIINVDQIQAWHVLVAGVVVSGMAVAGVSMKMNGDPRARHAVTLFSRWFTFALAAAATAWVFMAKIDGQIFNPVRMIALVCGVAVAWYVSALIRHHLEQQDKLTDEQRAAIAERETPFWELVLRDAGVNEVAVSAPQKTEHGVVINAHAFGKHVGALDKPDIAGRIASAANHRDPGRWALADSDVQVTPAAVAGQFTIHVHERNPLAETIHYVDDPGPADISAPVRIGRFIDLSPVEIDLLNHIEIVGESQSGKSTLLNLILAKILKCANAAVWMGGTWKFFYAVDPWLEKLRTGEISSVPFDYLAANQTDILHMLAGLYEEAARRLSVPRIHRPERPTREWPALFAVIDEASHSLTRNEKVLCHDGVRRNASELVELLSRGTAAAWCYVILATQRGTNPDYGVMGGPIKTNIRLRFVLRTEDPDDLYRVIPNRKAGMSTKLLVHQGAFYMQLGEAQPLPGKADYIPASMLAEIAAQRLYTCGQLPAAAGAQLTVGRAFDENGELVRESAFSTRWPDTPEELFDYLQAGQDGPPRSIPPAPAVGPRPNSPAPAPTAAATSPSDGGLGLTAIADEFANRMRDVRVDAVKNLDEDEVARRFAELTETEVLAAAEHPVPELLSRLLEEFGDREFVSTEDLARAVGMDAAKLGLTLSRDPYSIRRDKATERRPEYGGEAVRGYFIAALREVADEFRSGKRQPK